MPERVIPESNPEKSTIFLRIASLNVLSYGDYGDMSSRANDYSTDSLDLPLFVAVETVAEHAIRMFVDWPRLVGLEPLMAAARTAWRSAWAVQDALRSCLGWVRPRPWQQGLGRGNEVAARWPDPPASAMLAPGYGEKAELSAYVLGRSPV